jgi:3-hexulose-6-phosphate synthase/6-phospho-3-hexuloisomerase
VVAAVKAGADILVVGGAITKSENVGKAVRDMKKAVETRVPVVTKLYKRVSLENVREILLKVSTANISDALHRKGWLEDVHPVVPGVHMAGPAVTVRTYPGDWAKPVEAVDLAKAGEVIVIDAGGCPPAVWGELATHSCLVKKIAGVVIYGGIRDVQEVRRMKFPAFAKLITPSAGEPKGLGEIGVSLRIAGQSVAPGDWLVGDEDGVVVIPREDVAEVANRAMDVLEKENRVRREIREGGTLSQITEVLKWEKPK